MSAGRFVGLLAKCRLPVMYGQREFALEGGLMAYAANHTEIIQ